MEAIARFVTSRPGRAFTVTGATVSKEGEVDLGVVREWGQSAALGRDDLGVNDAHLLVAECLECAAYESDEEEEWADYVSERNAARFVGL